MSPLNAAKVFFLPLAKSIAPPDTTPNKMPFTAHRPDRLQATVLLVALLLYASAVALYFPIVKRTSGTWEARRRELITKRRSASTSDVRFAFPRHPQIF